MKKILHIIDDLSMGGAQNLLIGLTASQKTMGCDVTVLQLKEYSDKTVSDKIKSFGVKVESLTQTGSLYNPSLIFRLKKYFKHYDIVHVHLFPALYWAGIANLLTGRKTGTVYTEHSTKNKRRDNPILRLTDRLIYKHCFDKIIACSEKALETFRAVYPTVKHVCAINNGVDTKKYKNAEPYLKKELLGIDESCFVATMVARFMPMKRQDTILEAIAKLPANFHACFVGSDKDDVKLINVKKLAKSLNVEDRVHFMYIRSDVDRILKTSDAVIMSSEYEGLSLSSIEGMAAGKPFIATDVDGLREVVKGAGILFELYNGEQLANILLRLESDKDFYNETVEKCKVRASEYDLNKMVEQYMKVYNKVLDKRYNE